MQDTIPKLTRREWEILGIGILLGMLLLVLGQITARAEDTKPASLIETNKLPGVISLSGTTDDSMNNIATLNIKLTKPNGRWQIPDLGYYSSTGRIETQEENVGITTTMLNFTGEIPDLTKSIGNATNVTDINSTEPLLYL